MFSVQEKLLGKRVFDRRVYVFALAIFLLFVFDAVAIYFSWYYYYEWIDIPVHITGGFILALLFYYLTFANRWTRHLVGLVRSKDVIFTVMTFWVLVVAIGWEIVEFVAGRTRLSPKFPVDTFTDISVTVLGAYVAYLLVKELRIKYLK